MTDPFYYLMYGREKDIKQLAFLLAVILVVSGGILGGIWYSKQPKKMTGNFNIAVAQFGEIKSGTTPGPSANAEKISSTLFNFLDSEYQASGLGLSVQVAHKNMPLVIEEREAEELAKQVNANIVIFGNISGQGDQAEFFPRFYIAEQPDTSELTGASELANPIQFDISDLRSDNEIHAELLVRAEILSNFTKGLIQYSKKDLDSASSSVQAAIDSAEKSYQIAGEEALYLLAAKIKIDQLDFEGANNMLDQALKLNPNYARAYLLRGNIYYIQAKKPNAAADLLDKALFEYKQALNAKDQPEGAYIAIKAHTAMGNVLDVQAQKKNDDPILFDQAIFEYQYVTEKYEQTKDPSLRSYAAIAYFGLGVAYERQGQKSEDIEYYKKAIEYYKKAYDLTDDEERKTEIKDQIKIVQGY
jgi:tetratricopeptide (TPR) repeat protein